MPQTVHSIQFLRFVAAAMVVFFHTDVALNLTDHVSPSFNYYASFGASGVHIFFVISGFVMFYTSFRKKGGVFSASGFMLRRLIRIYPIYILYALAYLLFYGMLGTSYRLTIGQTIGSLLLVPDYSSLIIGPGWTLSYEVYFYVCFAIIMVLGHARGLSVLTFFFAISIAVSLVLRPEQPLIRLATNPLLMEFVAGAWIAFYVLYGRGVQPTVAKWIAVAGLACFSVGLVAGYSRLPSTLAWALPSALLVAGLVFMESGNQLPRRIKWISFLGDSSYSLYLLHILLIDAILYSTGPFLKLTSVGAATLCVIVTAACCMVAAIIYRLIEHPMLLALQGLFQARSAGDAVRKTHAQASSPKPQRETDLSSRPKKADIE